jgi:hypothetical protein
LARVGRREFGPEAINRRLDGVQTSLVEDVRPPGPRRVDIDRGDRLTSLSSAGLTSTAVIRRI